MPDVLTKETARLIGSQITFSDGVTLQVFARCRETGIGSKPIYYPGLALVFGAYRGANLSPLPYAWQNKAIQLPILVNSRRSPDVHGFTETLQANLMMVGFYDPAAAKRHAQVDEPPIMKFEQLRGIQQARNDIAWRNFVAGAGGTLTDLIQATSIRVQLPLADGSANVAEINPQDPTLKTLAQQCDLGFHAEGEGLRREASARQTEADTKRRAEDAKFNLRAGEMFTKWGTRSFSIFAYEKMSMDSARSNFEGQVNIEIVNVHKDNSGLDDWYFTRLWNESGLKASGWINAPQIIERRKNGTLRYCRLDPKPGFELNCLIWWDPVLNAKR